MPSLGSRLLRERVEQLAAFARSARIEEALLGRRQIGMRAVAPLDGRLEPAPAKEIGNGLTITGPVIGGDGQRTHDAGARDILLQPTA